MKKDMSRKDRSLILRFTLKVVCFYILVAGGWIYFSDMVLENIAGSPEQLSRLQTYKGMLFVLVTGILLFIYIHGEFKRRLAMERSYMEEIHGSYNRLLRTLDGTIRSISRILEIKDPYTQGHQKRVATLAVSIAEKMGLSEENRECIRISSLIHDVGKIGLYSDLLTRPGDLSELEQRMIKTHPDMGRDIVADIDFLCPVADIIHQHHERMDGSGYPRGLKGEEIHLFARIIAVADVVEAMSCDRPYRPASGLKDALETIGRERGTLFDARVVDACLDLFRKDGFSLEECQENK